MDQIIYDYLIRFLFSQELFHCIDVTIPILHCNGSRTFAGIDRKQIDDLVCFQTFVFFAEFFFLCRTQSIRRFPDPDGDFTGTAAIDVKNGAAFFLFGDLRTDAAFGNLLLFRTNASGVIDA